MILKGRLFWKILFGFWFTIIMMSQLLWVAFSLYRHEGPPEQRMARQLAERQLDSAAALLQRQGPTAVAALQASWPVAEQGLLRLEPVETEQSTTQTGRILLGADGQHYRLDYDTAGLQRQLAPPQPRSDWLNMPPPMWWIGGLGGLFFSALLAWHLTRPMNRFRQGFERLAQGDLGVRLYPLMRRRHDEISDAAHDFDAMAERLQLLVESREQLLHDVSHELRSPLARLQLAIGLAQQDPARIEGSLARIQLETQRMDKMIGELLTLTRASHGERDGEEYYDLQALVEDLEARLRPVGERQIRWISASVGDSAVGLRVSLIPARCRLRGPMLSWLRSSSICRPQASLVRPSVSFRRSIMASASSAYWSASWSAF